MTKSIHLFFIFFVIFANYSCQEKSEISKITETTEFLIISPDANSRFELETTNSFTVSWKAVTFEEKNTGSQIYDIVLLPENKSESAILIGSTSKTFFDIDSKELNSLLISVGYKPDVSLNFELMVIGKFTIDSSAHDKNSNKLPIHVKTYFKTFEYDKWFVIGTAVGGWESSNNKELLFNPVSKKYFLPVIEMSAGEFKFYAPEIDIDPWKYNLGAIRNTDPFPIESDRVNNINLIEGGKNFEVSAGFYDVSLDVVNKKLDILKISDNPTNAWYLISCDAVGTGVSIENSGAEKDEVWNFGNKLSADSKIGFLLQDELAMWLWSDIKLVKNEGFKLRAFNSEGELFINAGFKEVDLSRSNNLIEGDNDGNIFVTKDSHYSVKLSVNNEGISSIIITEKKQ